MVSIFKPVVLGCALAVAATSAVSQSLRDVAMPAEFPPASYKASQYVDSRGCIFIRAGLSGNVNWVPRVTRGRKPVCGFKPSLTAAQAQAAPPAAASGPAPQIIVPVTPSTGSSATQVSAPARDILPPPTVRRSPAVVAPQPRRISMAEACAGRTGILTGVINARTGQPVDCGPAQPAPAPQITQPKTQVAPLRQVNVDDASACLASVRAGRATAVGGVRCAPQDVPIVPYSRSTVSQTAPKLVTPQQQPRVIVPSHAQTSTPTLSQPSPWACLDAMRQGRKTITGPGGETLRCTPQTRSPSYFQDSNARGLGKTPAVSSRVAVPQLPKRSGDLADATPVRTSRPQVFGAAPPAGYRTVWTDGRLNPNRGLRVVRLK